jgi:hypothetical protein
MTPAAALVGDNITIDVALIAGWGTAKDAAAGIVNVPVIRGHIFIKAVVRPFIAVTIFWATVKNNEPPCGDDGMLI